MTYSVQIGAGGLAGWRMLQRTGEGQKSIIAKEAPVQRASTAFTGKMRGYTSVDDLISDKPGLKAALDAFGLSKDISDTGFIRRVLTSDTTDPRSFANNLKNSRYADLAKALSFGPDGGATGRLGDIAPGNRLETAEALVSDYRSLSVALTAFGLENDLPNKAFIRKVLESDLGDPKSFANRLSDKRYRKLAEAFSFGEPDGRIKRMLNAEKLASNYVSRTFELRVGESNEGYRLALNARRELTELAGRSSKETTKWYEVLGSTPLRRVLSGALGLNDSYLKLPIDRQLDEFRSAADRQLGIKSLADLADPKVMDKLLDRFIVRNAVTQNAASQFNVALTLLSR